MKASAGSLPTHLEQAPASTEKEASDADARFYLCMVLVSAVIVFLGFAPSFYLKPLIHAPPALTQLTITHGIVTTVWVLFFIVQASLIARKRPALHRQLGVLGAILFGAMVSLGLSTATTAARLGHAPPGAPPPLAFMALSFFGIVGVLALVGMGLWNRRRSDWHKRLMLASLFIMTGNGTGRIAIPLGFASQEITIGFVVTYLLLAVAVWYDHRAHKRVHPAYWVAAAAVVASHAGVMWAFGSPTWLAFAKAIA
jgi:hypothetical protein